VARSSEHGNEPSGSMKEGEFRGQLSDTPSPEEVLCHMGLSLSQYLNEGIIFHYPLSARL
jgi:hypothetical protein